MIKAEGRLLSSACGGGGYFFVVLLCWRIEAYSLLWGILPRDDDKNNDEGEVCRRYHASQ